MRRNARIRQNIIFSQDSLLSSLDLNHLPSFLGGEGGGVEKGNVMCGYRYRVANFIVATVQSCYGSKLLRVKVANFIVATGQSC